LIETLATDFEYEFIPIPEEYATTTHLSINPKNIRVSKVDARDSPMPVDSHLVASIKKRGLLHDPLVTYARHKKTKKEGWLMVAGRRRRAAAEEAELQEITVKIKEITSFKEYLICAGVENMKREDMSAWDVYRFILRLVSLGLKSKEVAKELSVTDGYVSQHLAFRRLDPRVQKMIKDAVQEPFKSAALTVARTLKRVNNTDQQFLIAEKAIKEKLTASGVERLVDEWEAENQQSGEQKEKKVGGKKKFILPEKLDESFIRFLEPKDAAKYINSLHLQLLKAKDNTKTTKERLQYLKGKIESALILSGVENPNKEESSETETEAEIE